MAELPLTVCRIDTPEGEKDYVTCLQGDQVFARGLPPEAIIGVLLRPLDSREEITPDVFARNSVFVKFMHSVIARRAPALPSFIAEARRQRDGWV